MYLDSYDKSKFSGPGNAAYVIKFIDQECPPLAWNMVAVKIMKHFVKNGLQAVSISATDEFPSDMLKAIDETLQKDYKIKLPL